MRSTRLRISLIFPAVSLCDRELNTSHYLPNPDAGPDKPTEKTRISADLSKRSVIVLSLISKITCEDTDKLTLCGDNDDKRNPEDLVYVCVCVYVFSRDLHGFSESTVCGHFFLLSLPSVCVCVKHPARPRLRSQGLSEVLFFLPRVL